MPGARAVMEEHLVAAPDQPSGFMRLVRARVVVRVLTPPSELSARTTQLVWAGAVALRNPCVQLSVMALMPVERPIGVAGE